MSKEICKECGWQGMRDDLLIASNPFCRSEAIYGCPFCKEVNVTIRACDHYGCWKEGACGNPTQIGYTWTCFEHQPNVGEAIAGCDEMKGSSNEMQ